MWVPDSSKGQQGEPLANVGCNRRDGRCRKWLSGIQLLVLVQRSEP